LADIHERARAEPAAPAPGALPQGRVFVGLLGLIAVVTALGLWAQPGSLPMVSSRPARQVLPRAPAAPTRAPASPAAQAPSPARLEGVFRALRARLGRAVRTRDAGAARAVSTPAGSVRARTGQVVRSLRRDGILDLTRIEPVVVRHVASRAGTAVLRERALLRPCLSTEDGRDVTRAPAAFLQVIRWQLRRRAGEWLLHRATLLRDEIVDSHDARCP
jgi:hypothetical protein